MAVSQLNSFALISTFVVACLAALCSAQARASGFSVDLFHRDSPGSPFYNPSEIHSRRLADAVRRSIDRARFFNGENSSVSLVSAQATITSNLGEYLMNMSLGSPPFPISAVIDTASGLTWTQCKPCKDCYKQIDPIFDPRKSTTYREISSKSPLCGKIFGTFSNGSSPCNFSIMYGDQSYTEGVLAIDTVTLRSTSSGSVAVPKTIFGCGFNNGGTFLKEGSGIVGLDRGPESLVSRLGSAINGKFSYCLLPYSSYEKSKTSKLHFGDKAVVAGAKAVSTPLFTVPGHPPRAYILNLEAISVGRKRLDFNETPFGSSDANIMVDSGTVLTLLPPKFYSKLESVVAEHIELKRVEDPNKKLSLCYENKWDDIKIPKFRVHLRGANLELTTNHIFLKISEDVVCFAVAPVEDFALIGNLAQVNFLVGYDTVKGTMTFKPTDCSGTK